MTMLAFLVDVAVIAVLCFGVGVLFVGGVLGLGSLAGWLVTLGVFAFFAVTLFVRKAQGEATEESKSDASEDKVPLLMLAVLVVVFVFLGSGHRVVVHVEDGGREVYIGRAVLDENDIEVGDDVSVSWYIEEQDKTVLVTARVREDCGDGSYIVESSDGKEFTVYLAQVEYRLKQKLLEYGVKS